MQKYVCKNCDAELYWDVKHGCLKCEYCDAEYQPSDFKDQEKLDAPEDNNGVAAEADQEITDDTLQADELVVYKCMHCGAEIVTSAGTVATTCGYCGRAIAFESKLQDKFKPLAIIPFSVTKKQALKILNKYLKHSPLTPRKYIETLKTTKIVGMYCPYWLHSFDSDARAEVEAVIRKEKSTTKIQIDMRGHASFKYIPTDALTHISDQLTNAIEPFNYSHAKRFDPAFMAGFYSERFNDDPGEAFEKSRKKSEYVMKKHLEINSGYRDSTVKEYKDSISNYDITNVMLPIWIVHAEYNNKKFVYVINGDTGAIAGDIPVSYGRLTLFTVGSGLLILLLNILGQLGGIL